MAIKNPPPAPKHSGGQNVHPETKQPQPSTGVPGQNSSKQKGGVDPRTAHDKDGNEEQTKRTVAAP